ncbi:MAG: desaturase [Sylvanvirus sp.]|uniref:Desaturase n=1 Tax=Sylvanvirus sp. TaxID=2487774 RepID=A0A3G5AHI8_9VIRU|nr:MAG: desaturase [Sylvanvirus sp.]
MFIGFVVIIGLLGLIFCLERVFPSRPLPLVKGWWTRVLMINLFQLFTVVLGMFSWEVFLGDARLFHLKDHVSPLTGGVIAYLINTWFFYFFHKLRHQIYFFWVYLHQVHHSVQRLEAFASFVKSPLEIVVDSILMCILLYPILGLRAESSIWLSFFSAIGEYIYHMNISTPHWVGYIFQRPESHRLHHLRHKREHCVNYSDLPIWDWLGGTFYNPDYETGQKAICGFLPHEEERFMDMIQGVDVTLPPGLTEKNTNGIRYNRWTFCALGLIFISLAQTIGYCFEFPLLKGFGFATVASPLPLVFSVYNGVETFSTRMELFACSTVPEHILDCESVVLSRFTTGSMKPSGTDSLTKPFNQSLTQSLILSLIQSLTLTSPPYNVRNAFGALLSYGPFFTDRALVKLRNNALQFGLCHQGPLAKSLDLGNNLSIRMSESRSEPSFFVRAQSKVSNHTGMFIVFCPELNISNDLPIHSHSSVDDLSVYVCSLHLQISIFDHT